MRTVSDIKKALDFDLYVDLIPQMRKERAEKLKAQAEPKRPRRNTWVALFPACKGARR